MPNTSFLDLPIILSIFQSVSLAIDPAAYDDHLNPIPFSVIR